MTDQIVDEADSGYRYQGYVIPVGPAPMKLPHQSLAGRFAVLPLIRIAAWLYVIQAATGFGVGFVIPWLRFFQLATY